MKAYNNRIIYIISIALVGISGLLVACGPSQEDRELMKRATAMFGTMPEQMPGSENDSRAMIALGEKLYFEKRLSSKDNQSCNTCHRVDQGYSGSDNLPVSPGSKPGSKGNRSAPSVYNAGFHISQFWDGRAADLVEQAKGPVLNPAEMAMQSEEEVVAKLSGVDEYATLFARAYPEEEEPITYHNIARSIAAFERTLISTDRFDDYMNGDASALSAKEKEGLKLFMDEGCIQCHNGPLLGAKTYQKMGRNNPYADTVDKGRFEVTGKQEDMYVYKVSPLRNIALTAPYFHDGKAATLEEAVSQMAYLQLDKKLEKEKVDSIVAFLESLNGKGLKAIENPENPPAEVPNMR